MYLKQVSSKKHKVLQHSTKQLPAFVWCQNSTVRTKKKKWGGVALHCKHCKHCKQCKAMMPWKPWKVKSSGHILIPFISCCFFQDCLYVKSKILYQYKIYISAFYAPISPVNLTDKIARNRLCQKIHRLMSDSGKIHGWGKTFPLYFHSLNMKDQDLLVCFEKLRWRGQKKPQMSTI